MKLYIWTRFNVLLFYIVTVGVVDASECIKTGPCTCSTKTRTVDFSSLNGAGNEPRFSIKDTRNYLYAYNPCKSFILLPVGNCQEKDITLFQATSDKKFCFPLGKYSTLSYHGDPDEGNLKIRYTHLDQVPVQMRVVEVKVICTHDQSSFRFDGEVVHIHYNFTLFTDVVCPVSSGLSTGSILVIIFFVAVIIYFVGGILLLKFVRKAEGIEMVPNISFWTEIPLLVRDGIFFVFRGCKVQSPYEKI